jgi:thiamine pyrophosphokinase
MKNKAIIFVNGNLSDLNFSKKLIDETTFLIGADGGADKIYGLGYKPDAVIGDFDSLQNIPDKIKNLQTKNTGTEAVVSGTTYRKFPTDKDSLDTELAIDFALEKGFCEIILVNTLGDETDHMLGVIFLLNKPKFEGINIRIMHSSQEIFIVSGEVKLVGEPGGKISLIPLFGEVKVESSSGLKYDPSKYSMTMQNNIGISNEFVSESANMKIPSGKFLAVKTISH